METLPIPSGAGETPVVPTPDLFLQHLPTIESVIKFVVVRHRLTADEADDFAATVRLRLLDHDCATLRKFRGHSSLRAFLGVVILRLYRDYRTAQWGRWRPCAEARRTGPLAIRLDRLLSRDGFTFDEAVEILRVNHGVTEDGEAIRELAARFPMRLKRRPVDVRGFEDLVAVPVSPFPVPALEKQAERALEALRAAVQRISSEERLVLSLFFANRLCIAQIARRCGLDQKALYRSFTALLKRLRVEMQTAGITAADADVWIGRPDLDMARAAFLRPVNEHE